MGKETVEQGFDRIYDSMDFTEFCFPSFKLGVKWEQEKMIDLIQFLSMNEEFNGYGSVSKETAKHFLELFKNK